MDLPARTLTLSSLCSPGCLPQANSAWEHWKTAGNCRILLIILLLSHSWSQIKALSQLYTNCSSVYYTSGHPLPTLLVGSPGLCSWPLWEQGDNCYHWQGMKGKHVWDSAACSRAMAKPCSEREPHPASPHFCGGQMLILSRPPSLPNTAAPTNGASAVKQYHFQGVCVGPGRRGHLNEQLGVLLSLALELLLPFGLVAGSRWGS